MKINLITVGILILVALVGYGILFWPTPYAYEERMIGKTSFPVRTNRFTGRRQYKLVTGEWKPLVLHEGKSDNSESKSLSSNGEWNTQEGNLSVRNMLEVRARGGTKMEDRTDDPRFYTVQVGAFKDPEKAEQLHDELIYSGYQAKMEYPEPEGEDEYRVLIGEFRNREDAISFAKELQEGLKDGAIHILGEE